MTMFVDRRKDNYDELLLLANDARVSRTRTNRWSTGLIAGAIIGTGAYVATINQEVHDVRETAENAVQQRDTAELAYERLLGERNLLKAELETLARYQDLYAEVMPTNAISNSISRLAPGPIQPGPGVSQTTTQLTTQSLVWMVDGSRRFPVIDGDILWIPEGGFWVQLRGPADARTLYKYNTNPAGTAGTTGGTLMTLPFREAVVRKGTHDCVDITLHTESLRPLFRAQGYVDVEVTYFTPDNTNKCISGVQ